MIAIGSGSLFFSHVNDAGFWSLMETVISVSGLVFVLLLSPVM